MSKLCEYYFAPQSPWAYLGHGRLVAMAKVHGVQVEPKPCDLGKIFPASGGLPLAQRAPQRQAHRLLELARWSEYLQLPLNLHPQFFPVSGDCQVGALPSAPLRRRFNLCFMEYRKKYRLLPANLLTFLKYTPQYII